MSSSFVRLSSSQDVYTRSTSVSALSIDVTVKDPGSEGRNMGRYSSDSELYWDSGDSAFRTMKKARERKFLVFAVVSKIASNRDRLEGYDRMVQVQACGPEENMRNAPWCFFFLSFFIISRFNRDSTN